MIGENCCCIQYIISPLLLTTQKSATSNKKSIALSFIRAVILASIQKGAITTPSAHTNIPIGKRKVVRPKAFFLYLVSEKHFISTTRLVIKKTKRINVGIRTHYTIGRDNIYLSSVFAFRVSSLLLEVLQAPLSLAVLASLHRAVPTVVLFC